MGSRSNWSIALSPTHNTGDDHLALAACARSRWWERLVSPKVGHGKFALLLCYEVMRQPLAART